MRYGYRSRSVGWRVLIAFAVFLASWGVAKSPIAEHKPVTLPEDWLTAHLPEVPEWGVQDFARLLCLQRLRGGGAPEYICAVAKKAVTGCFKYHSCAGLEKLRQLAAEGGILEQLYKDIIAFREPLVAKYPNGAPSALGQPDMGIEQIDALVNSSPPTGAGGVRELLKTVRYEDWRALCPANLPPPEPGTMRACSLVERVRALGDNRNQPVPEDSCDVPWPDYLKRRDMAVAMVGIGMLAADPEAFLAGVVNLGNTLIDMDNNKFPERAGCAPLCVTLPASFQITSERKLQSEWVPELLEAFLLEEAQHQYTLWRSEVIHAQTEGVLYCRVFVNHKALTTRGAQLVVDYVPQ